MAIDCTALLSFDACPDDQPRCESGLPFSCKSLATAPNLSTASSSSASSPRGSLDLALVGELPVLDFGGLVDWGALLPRSMSNAEFTRRFPAPPHAPELSSVLTALSAAGVSVR